MKLSCEIIQDLLPLYDEDLCSPQSREAVEEHLKTCPQCCKKVEQSRSFTEPQLSQMAESSKEDAAVAKSFRKIRRRWWTSLAAVFLTIPIVLLSVNQYRRQGICFTNLDDIWKARQYCAALAAGDFEKAAECMDYERLYQEVQDVLSWSRDSYSIDQEVQDEATEDRLNQYTFNQQYYGAARDMTYEEFKTYVKNAYVSDLQSIADRGYIFKVTGYQYSYYLSGNGGWVICYNMTISDANSTHYFVIDLTVRENGLDIGAMSNAYPNELDFDLAELLFFGYPGNKS